MKHAPIFKRSAAVLATVVAITLAGCSAGGDSGPADDGSESVTIGIIPIVGAQSEVLTQAIAGIEAGAELLGWEVTTIDPEGSGQKIQAAMSAMVTQKVSAIFTLGIDAPLLGNQLSAAKDAGIPVIAVNNGVDPETSSLFTALITPTEDDWGQTTGDFMTESLTPAPVIQVVNNPYTSRHMAEVAMAIAEPEGFDLLTVQETDITNILPSYQAATRDGLLANPTAKYLLSPGDFSAGIMVPILKQIEREDVTIISRYDNQPTIELMRQGSPLVIVTTSLYLPGLIALDEVAAFLKDGTPIESVESDFPFKVVTTDDIDSYPSSGYLFPLEDELAPFQEKWASEYGIE